MPPPLSSSLLLSHSYFESVLAQYCMLFSFSSDQQRSIQRSKSFHFNSVKGISNFPNSATIFASS